MPGRFAFLCLSWFVGVGVRISPGSLVSSVRISLVLLHSDTGIPCSSVRTFRRIVSVGRSISVLFAVGGWLVAVWRGLPSTSGWILSSWCDLVLLVYATP